MLADKAKMHERVQPTAEEGGGKPAWRRWWCGGWHGGCRANESAGAIADGGGSREKQHVAGVPEGGRQWRRGRGVTALRNWLKGSWPSVRAAVLGDQYIPQAVTAVCGTARMV